MTTIDTLTEPEKDRIAYEACGYVDVELDTTFEIIPGGFPRGKVWRGRRPKWDARVVTKVLGDWTRTDAAIEHAERGGFRIREARQLPARERPDDANRWDVHIAVDDPRGGVSTKSFGSGRSQATAIRNAIVAWHLAQKGTT